MLARVRGVWVMESSKKPQGESLAAKLIEVLDDLAWPGASEVLVEAALRRKDLEHVPENVEEFRTFVEEPLLIAVCQRLGAGAGEEMLQRLRPSIEVASSHVRQVRQRKTPRAATASRSVPMVLLLSMDAEIASDVAFALRKTAAVRVVRTAPELVQAVENMLASRILLVVDAASSPFDAADVAWVGMLAGTNLSIVHWGADASQRSAVEAVAGEAGERWVHLHEPSTAALAAVVTRLLEPFAAERD
jgi:hypothetical protein